MTRMPSSQKVPRRQYEQAAAKYRPQKTRVLFVAEAPPSSLDRYFYFEDVGKQDSLWLELMKALFEMKGGRNVRAERARKPYWLRRFQDSGCQLIDAVKDPMDCDSPARLGKIRGSCADVISEIRLINPDRIVLIKATVYDALFHPLKEAGLPVLSCKLPFPGNGHQREFHLNFPSEVLTILSNCR